MLIPPEYGKDATTPFFFRTFPVKDMLNGPEPWQGPERHSIYRTWAKAHRHAILIEPWELRDVVQRKNGMIELDKHGNPQIKRKYVPCQPVRSDVFDPGCVPPEGLIHQIMQTLKWKRVYWAWTPLQETKHGRMLVSCEPFRERFKGSKHASACNIPSTPMITEGTVLFHYNKECK